MPSRDKWNVLPCPPPALGGGLGLKPVLYEMPCADPCSSLHVLPDKAPAGFLLLKLLTFFLSNVKWMRDLTIHEG